MVTELLGYSGVWDCRGGYSRSFCDRDRLNGVGQAAASISKVMTPKSLVLTIQNGLGAGDRIAQHMKTDNVLLGVVEGFGASIKAPDTFITML